ncbi:MAG: hypothetical protein AB7L92_08050 [Alphaproteobacteria bacterium]
MAKYTTDPQELAGQLCKIEPGLMAQVPQARQEEWLAHGLQAVNAPTAKGIGR